MDNELVVQLVDMKDNVMAHLSEKQSVVDLVDQLANGMAV
jgi:hypothetical protein